MYFLANSIPDQDTSVAVYRVHAHGGGHAQEQQVVEKLEKVAHWEVDCAAGLAQADSSIVLDVEHGLEDQLRLQLGGKTPVAQNKRIVDYDVSGALYDLHTVLSCGNVNTPIKLSSFDPSTGESL